MTSPTARRHASIATLACLLAARGRATSHAREADSPAASPPFPVLPVAQSSAQAMSNPPALSYPGAAANQSYLALGMEMPIIATAGASPTGSAGLIFVSPESYLLFVQQGMTLDGSTQLNMSGGLLSSAADPFVSFQEPTGVFSSISSATSGSSPASSSSDMRLLAVLLYSPPVARPGAAAFNWTAWAADLSANPSLRIGFDIQDFATRSGLGEPVAAEILIVQDDITTPTDNPDDNSQSLVPVSTVISAAGQTESGASASASATGAGQAGAATAAGGSVAGEANASPSGLTMTSPGAISGAGQLSPSGSAAGASGSVAGEANGSPSGLTMMSPGGIGGAGQLSPSGSAGGASGTGAAAAGSTNPPSQSGSESGAGSRNGGSPGSSGAGQTGSGGGQGRTGGEQGRQGGSGEGDQGTPGEGKQGSGSGSGQQEGVVGGSSREGSNDQGSSTKASDMKGSGGGGRDGGAADDESSCDAEEDQAASPSSSVMPGTNRTMASATGGASKNGLPSGPAGMGLAAGDMGPAAAPKVTSSAGMGEEADDNIFTIGFDVDGKFGMTITTELPSFRRARRTVAPREGDWTMTLSPDARLALGGLVQATAASASSPALAPGLSTLATTATTMTSSSSPGQGARATTVTTLASSATSAPTSLSSTICPISRLHVFLAATLLLVLNFV